MHIIEEDVLISQGRN